MPSKFGSLVAAARRAKKWSLRELAKRIDKSPSFVSMLENEDPPPSVSEETLRVLARELSLELDELLGLVGKVPGEALPDSGLDVALYRRVKKLTDKEKRTLLKDLSEER